MQTIHFLGLKGYQIFIFHDLHYTVMSWKVHSYLTFIKPYT